MVWTGLFGIVLVTIGIVLVSFTPLREYIPGYPDGNIRWLYLQNAIKMDSLEEQIVIRDQYIENIRLILRGKETKRFMGNSDTVPEVSHLAYVKENFDSVLGMDIQDAQRLSYHKGKNN